MESVKAERSDVQMLAELNKALIAEERHPDPLNIAQLLREVRLQNRRF